MIRVHIPSLGIRSRWASFMNELRPGPGSYITPGRVIRHLLKRWRLLSCYVPTRSGAWLYLSHDPIDEDVIREFLGESAQIYFPELPDSLRTELAAGGVMLDLGAYNGFWAAEMLRRHPGSRAILMEPNPEKLDRIAKTLRFSRVANRARVVPSALGTKEGTAWLIASPEGSWGDWTQEEKPGTDIPVRAISAVNLKTALAGARPLVIKCNAEGAEYTLVAQMLDNGLRPRLIILMAHPEFGDLGQLWKVLTDAGYRLTVELDHPTRPCWHATIS